MAIWDNVRDSVKSGKYADDELNYQIVQIRKIDSIIEISDIPGQTRTHFVIAKISIEVDEAGMYTILHILPVDDNGDETGEPVLTINEDMYDIRVVD